ncbi:MAG: acyl-CoA dehydrogenase family protein [Rhodocyclaceae bacterium]|jgi:alkylation response protein AidB-like acyl-CoA dehydrogenase|nr:acyl-CoA dehydrogenase family protein [Rhodocyclaceae bacterium]
MNDPRVNTDYNELSDEEFRRRFREFLAAHYPPELRQDPRRPFFRLRGAAEKEWLQTLYRHGWRAPAWPKEFGGMGLSFGKQLIYNEELARAATARVVDNSETMLGPTLIQFGTEEQKAYYLPRILSCEDMWAQGYSEPGAGSDLAALRTQAVRDGDDFIVNGQKIWTTMAMDRTHIFTLVRTSKLPKKQQGISFLLIDLKAPGVTIRPIYNISGEDEFCEVFFDNVRVPAKNLVGEVDRGWTIAKALLGHERIWIGSPALAIKALEVAKLIVAETGQDQDPGVMDQLAALSADLHDYLLLYAEMCAIVKETEEPGPEVSVLKVFISELLQRITEFNVEIGQEYGGIVGDAVIGGTTFDLHWPMMMARPTTIFAGANEVQRDILAKAVLKMPSEPRPGR